MDICALQLDGEKYRLLQSRLLQFLVMIVSLAFAPFQAGHGQICISEIMYRPASENTKEEFIE
ncbi:MAG: hypothetical protein N3G20_12090, partial [Verrucomicrobiae bacterium]|nr:hypothetical protein [Verrucomicrobiae bacterium]